mgnify:CR=1 FL=1
MGSDQKRKTCKAEILAELESTGTQSVELKAAASGWRLIAGNHTLYEGPDGADAAAWRGALAELQMLGYLESVPDARQGRKYRLTEKGQDRIDLIASQKPSLVECACCGRQISSQATACPGCGHPQVVEVSAQETSDGPRPLSHEGTESDDSRSRVQTIEKTAKVWKAAMLAGACTLLLGLGGCLRGYQWGQHLTVLGAAIYVWARLAAWWKHG